MDKNKNCSVCNIKLDKDNYKKDRTGCKECYNKKKRKNSKNNLIQNEMNTSYQQSKLNSINVNNGTLLVGPSFSGKTYLMLKILSRIPKRDIHIIRKTPPEKFQF